MADSLNVSMRDLETETLLKPVANEKTEKKFIWRLYLLVAHAVLLSILVTGPVANYTALKPALLESKVYANLCGTDWESTCVPSKLLPCCEAQNLALNRLPQIAFGGFYVLLFVAGELIVRLGNVKRTVILGGVVISICWIVAAFVHDPNVPFWVTSWLFPACWLFATLIGCTMYLAFMVFYLGAAAKVQPNAIGFFNGFLSGAWDLSGIVFWVFVLIYNQGVSLKWIFLGYGVLVFVLVIPSAFFMDPDYSLLTEKNKPDVDTKPPSFKQTFTEDAPNIMILTVWLYAIITAPLGYFYLSTVPDQIGWVTNVGKINEDTATAHNLTTAFSVLLPALAVCAPLVGIVFYTKKQGVRTAWRGALLSQGLGTVWVACSMMKIANLQYITFIFFILWRMSTFLFSNQLIQQYCPKNFSRLSVVGYTISGIGTFLTPVFNKLVVSNQHFFWVNFIMFAVSSIPTAILIGFGYALRDANYNGLRLTKAKTRTIND